jgi:single-strand DNA-binding protein
MSINTGTLSGNLTQDPKVFSGGGVAVFTVASNRSEENTDYVSVKALGKTAEVVAANLQKGDKVSLQYGVRSSRYEKDGQTQYSQDLVIQKIEF